jgi:hypothetical protein
MILKLILFFSLLVAIQGAGNYNVTTAYEQLMLSYSAYCEANVVKNFSCYWCLHSPELKNFMVTATFFNASSNIFGYVGYRDNSGEYGGEEKRGRKCVIETKRKEKC